MSAGSRGYLHGTLSLNVPLGESAAFRFSGFGRQRDGFVDALQYDNFQLGEENVWGVRGALRIFPTDNVTIDLVGDYSQRRDSPAAVVPLLLGNISVNGDQINASGIPVASRFNVGGPPPVPPVPAGFGSGNPAVCGTAVGRNSNTDCYGNVWLGNGFQSNAKFTDSAGNFFEPENALDVYGLGLTVAIETGIGEIKSITAVRGFEAEFYNDFDFSPHIIFHNLNLPFNQDQFSQELQLTDSGAAGGLIDYVVGLYYFREEGLQTIDLVAPLLPPAAVQTTLPLFQSIDREAINTSKAAYAQLTLHPTDTIHLTGGIRYTDESKEVIFTQTRSVPNTPETAAGEQSIEEVDFMGNISVNVTDDVMAYATYSTGFRSGGFASRYPSGLVTPLPSFDPEFVTSYEVGLKSTLFGGNVRVNFAAFLTDYTNLQVTAVSPDPALAGAADTENLADATLQGIELEIDAAVTDYLRMNFSAGLLEDDIDSIVGGSLAAGSGNQVLLITTDNDLPYTPAVSLSAGFTHFLPLDFGEFRTRVDWNYTSRQQLRIENHPLTEQESYHRINANITFTPDASDFDFTLGVRNLTDANYSTAAAIASDASSISANVARPREFYGRVSVKF
jgi:iron complex outermembrane receptor protein